MEPKLTMKETGRVYIDKDFISNGHFLATRAVAQSHIAPKTLKALTKQLHGTYRCGAFQQESTPDLHAVVPKREGYAPFKHSGAPTGVSFRNEFKICSYKFELASGETIGITHSYVPIARLGTCYGKTPKDPILVLGGTSINDELVAVIMPIRLEEVKTSLSVTS